MALEDRIRSDYAWAVARGQAVALAEQRRLWPAAVRDGIVTGPPPPILRAMPSAREVSVLQRYLSGVVQSLADQVLGRFTRDVAKRIGELGEQAVVEGWTRRRFRAEVEAFSELAGVELKGSWIETWYRTFILAEGYNSGLLIQYQAEPTRRLFPAMSYNDQHDSRVRPIHRKLGTPPLVAPTMWDGWRRIKPPIAWRCRCYLKALDWRAFRALGVSLEQLENAANARLSSVALPAFG
jgi:hypothetical protein